MAIAPRSPFSQEYLQNRYHLDLDPKFWAGDLPKLILVTCHGDKDVENRLDRVKNSTLRDERVALTARFFVNVEVVDSRMLTLYPKLRTKKLPAILLKGKGDPVVLEANTSPSRLFREMLRVANKSLPNCRLTEGVVRDWVKALYRLDRIFDQKTRLVAKAEDGKLPEKVQDELAQLAEEEKEVRAILETTRYWGTKEVK